MPLSIVAILLTGFRRQRLLRTTTTTATATKSSASVSNQTKGKTTTTPKSLKTIDLSTANESANVAAKNAATIGLFENGESDRGNGQGRNGRRRRWWKSGRGGRQTHQKSAATTSTMTQSRSSTNGGGRVRGDGKTYRRGRGRS